MLLLGPSGSGKSTLLHALAGVLGDNTPGDNSASAGSAGAAAEDSDETGTLLIDGAAPRARRGRSGLFQQDPETQVVLSRLGDDVAFGAENLSVPAAEIWPRVARGARRRRAGPAAAGPPDVGPLRRAEAAAGARRHPGDAARADPARRAHRQPRPRRRPGGPRRRGPLPGQDRRNAGGGGAPGGRLEGPGGPDRGAAARIGHGFRGAASTGRRTGSWPQARDMLIGAGVWVPGLRARYPRRAAGAGPLRAPAGAGRTCCSPPRTWPSPASGRAAGCAAASAPSRRCRSSPASRPRSAPARR